jgi:hypothetical protein
MLANANSEEMCASLPTIPRQRDSYKQDSHASLSDLCVFPESPSLDELVLYTWM